MDNREPLESASRDHVGDHHHSGKQEDDIEIDVREGRLLADDAQGHDEETAEQRNDRPVDLVGDDDDVRRQKTVIATSC